MTATQPQWDIVTGLGLTAVAVALARAIESRRPDGLIEDPYAAEFLRACPLPPVCADWPRPEAQVDDPDSLWGSLPSYVGVRTKVFDDYLTAAAQAGVTQVVLLAAGLDSRALRLDWPPGVTVFELDVPHVLAFKEEVLAGRGSPRCERRLVAADLREDWTAELARAGFDPSRPTAWLAEGLLAFLTPAVEAALFAGVSALSAPGSRLALEAAPGNDRHGVLKSRFTSAEERIGIPVGDLWQFESRPEPVDALQRHGWTVHLHRVIEAADRYGCDIPGVMNEAAMYTKLLDATFRPDQPVPHSSTV